MHTKSAIWLTVAMFMANFLVPGSVSAEEQASDEYIEEVVVTGIRSSVITAMDVKRDSDGVVDSISAEDIAKFPDANLAESLQRITGVSIDRQGGEGNRQMLQ